MLSRSAVSRAVSQILADIKSVSSDASDLIVALVDRLIHVVYPKDSSTHPTQVINRIDKLYPPENGVPPEWVVPVVESKRLGYNPSAFPVDTIKKMVRVHAGNVSFDRDAELFAENAVQIFVNILLIGIVNRLGVIQTLEGRHIVEELYSHGGLHDMGLDAAPLGPIEKIPRDPHRSGSKKRRSSGKKRRSGSKKRRSGSKKRCPSNKTPVRSFIRDGKLVKSYCRKK